MTAATGPGATGALAAALADVVGAGPVSGLRRLSGGASRQTWAFDAGARPLILQQERPGGVRRAGMATEAALLGAAAAEGVPVPAVVASDGSAAGAAALGPSWLVVERVPGET
ncbi:MAG TPA: phosphotransferase, partial [Acidimicrobiales bacterium]|nr:phosphotransferase [Acidimicrobiales bacterium]